MTFPRGGGAFLHMHVLDLHGFCHSGAILSHIWYVRYVYVFRYKTNDLTYSGFWIVLCHLSQSWQIHIDGHSDMGLPQSFRKFPYLRWPKNSKELEYYMQANDLFIIVSNVNLFNNYLEDVNYIIGILIHTNIRNWYQITSIHTINIHKF